MTKEEIYQHSEGGLAIFEHLIPDIKRPYKKGTLFKSVFRDEKTGSANLIEKDGIWRYYDFGDDDKPLNAIDFIMKLRSVDFVSALKMAADFANLPKAELKPSPVIPTIMATTKQVEKVLERTDTPLHKYCRSIGITDAHLASWLLGGHVNKHGWEMTSFVFADHRGYHNIKHVWYDADTGKRIKKSTYQNAKTKALEEQKVYPSSLTKEGYRYGFCLFGAHRVNVDNSDRPLVIVESEKTAIIASYFYPDYDFVASHGLNGGDLEQFLSLMETNPDKPVVVLCDADVPRKTPTIFKELEAAKWNVHLVDLYPERTDKCDLADLIHERKFPTIKVPPSRQVVDKETGDSYYLSTKPDWNVVQAIKAKEEELTPKQKRLKWRKEQEEQARNPNVDENGKVIQMRESFPSDFIQDEAFTDEYDPLPMFFKTGIYMYKNCFWTIHEGKPKCISNFVFRIAQEIKNSKNVIRLVELKNEMGETRMVEMESKDLVTLGSFQTFCLDQGYFEFFGGPAQLAKLRTYAGAVAAKASTIENLGWQRKQGFFAFCNGIIKDGTFHASNNNGLVQVGDYTYFIPFGNETNDSVDMEFQSERRVVFKERDVHFDAWSGMHYEVHGKPGMIGQLFAIMTLFSDIIARVQVGFPVIMLYGEGSSGKGALAKSIQVLFGEPQDGIALNNGASTIKGKIRSLAEFINMPVLLEEYVKDKVNDEMIKTIWDRIGYKMGVMNRKTGTQSIPITCSAIVTSNQYPVVQPLIQRLIILEMHTIARTEEQLMNYNILSDIESGNLSQLLLQLLAMRKTFEERFAEEYKRILSKLVQTWPKLEGSRMYSNAASILATMVLTSEVFHLPYNYKDVDDYLRESLSVQVQKLTTGGEASSFFEAIGYAIQRGEMHEHTHFSCSGSELIINVSRVMSYYMLYCRQVTNTEPLARTTLFDKLKNYKAFVESKDSVRIGKGDDKKSSAMVFNMELIDTEIMEIIQQKRVQYKS